MNHTETQTGYGVLVTRKDGTKELMQNGGPIYFTTWECFAELSQKLESEDGTQCKVVRIKATWEVVE